MNRRGFLSALTTLGVAIALPGLELDPGKSLWIPGTKKFFDLGATPPTTEIVMALHKDAFAMTMDQLFMPVEDIDMTVFRQLFNPSMAAIEGSVRKEYETLAASQHFYYASLRYGKTQQMLAYEREVARRSATDRYRENQRRVFGYVTIAKNLDPKRIPD